MMCFDRAANMCGEMWQPPSVYSLIDTGVVWLFIRGFSYCSVVLVVIFPFPPPLFRFLPHVHYYHYWRRSVYFGWFSRLPISKLHALVCGFSITIFFFRAVSSLIALLLHLFVFFKTPSRLFGMSFSRWPVFL